MWKVRLSSVTPKHPQIDAQHVNRGALMRQVILALPGSRASGGAMHRY